jgi:MYXO-CTERM domain-containing protein
MRRSVASLDVVLMLASATARADVTTTPYPGVTHVKHARGVERWHVVGLDLATTGLAVRVSSEANRGKKLSEIATAEHAQIAINGAIFRKDYSLCGVALSSGAPWASVDDGACGHAIGWSDDLRTWTLFTGKGLAKGPFPNAVTEATGGYPTLVRGGVSCDGTHPEVCTIPPLAPADFKGPNPRTFLGVDQKRTKAFLVVVDGREIGAATGMTLVEAARFMATTVGAWDAVNLDGGGSSELWIASEGGIVNAPSDGGERTIADAIVVTLANASMPTASAAAGAGAMGSASASGSGSASRKKAGCGCEVAGERHGAEGAIAFSVVAAIALVRRRRIAIEDSP